MSTTRWITTRGPGLFVMFAATVTAFAQTAAPVITTQPANRAVTVGATATFTVTATGNPAPTYQWRKNAVPIGGATAATYVTPVTISADNGSLFAVVVSNSAGSVTSNNATLTVNALPTVDVDGPIGVPAGQTATFTTAASAGTPPYTYQWFRNGVLPANLIPGATSSTYTTPPVTVPGDDNSTYFVRITDSSGITVTSAAELLFVFKANQTITFVAPNNPVVSPPSLTLNATASSGLPVAFSVVSGPATLVGNSVTFTATGTVTLRASQPGNVNFNPATNVDRTVTVVAKPVVGGQGGVPAGQTATFNVTANFGTPPHTFQWFRNGDQPANIIAGATSDSYTTLPTTVAGDHLSTYTARITDSQGIVVFATPLTLTVSKLNQTIAFNAPANAVVSPTPITPPATATSGLPVSFSVVSGPATALGANVTLAAVGSVTLRALQAGNSEYNPAPNVDRTFTVAKGTPVITWATPAAVVAGTALGAAQLNATANVPGTFVYTPPSGTAVNVPSQTLNVAFTPNDTLSYNNASAQRVLTVNPPGDPARLTNVSVRTTLPAAQVLIVGFTMQGGAKTVLLRAIGPGLNQFQVPGTMSDPLMTIFSPQATALETNDNWGGGAALSGAFGQVGAFPLPAASLDAALLRSINGGHTAQVTGPAGVVLVEVYDAGTGVTPRLTNISARNRAGTGSDILIAGFTVLGTGQRNLLIRGVGPGLMALGVPGTLFNPRLEIFSGSTRIADNDNWNPALANTFSSVGAFPLTVGSLDAALTIMLAAGGYTVQVSGADGGTGEAIVEIYELP